MISNINKHNLKILSVSIVNNNYEFKLIGYSGLSSQEGILKINNNILTCKLINATNNEVSFGPKNQDLFFWTSTVNVPKEFINNGENQISLSVNNHQYPIEAWFEAPQKGIVVPEIENIKRVSGFLANKVTYRNGGRTEYLRYKYLFDKYLIKNDSKYLLDWGIGCARIAQQFKLENKYEITGIDIDSININWCKDNLTNITPILVDTSPPIPIGNDKFDVVISSSVLSHLVPKHWNSWLAEINRVINSNGMAFISFHGDNSISSFFGNNEQIMQTFKDSGYLDNDASKDLGADFEDYYRNTFYTDDYAKTLFSEHFNVIDIVPGLLSGLQSVAVLKPKRK